MNITDSLRPDDSIAVPSGRPRSNRVLAAAGAAVMGAGALAVAFFDPSKSNFFPTCPLYALTGLACPGCGLTRGFHALFHGDVITAIDFNALILVWAVIFGYVFLSLMVLAFRGSSLYMWPTRPRFLWGFMIVLIGFGFLRNLPVYPFTILFP